MHNKIAPLAPILLVISEPRNKRRIPMCKKKSKKLMFKPQKINVVKYV